MPSVQVDKIHPVHVTPVEDEIVTVKSLGSTVYYKEEPAVSQTNKSGELTTGQTLTIENQAGIYFIAAEGGALLEIKQPSGQAIGAEEIDNEAVITRTIKKGAVTPPTLSGEPNLGANDLLGYGSGKFVSVVNKTAFWLPSEVIDETVPGRITGSVYGGLTSGTLLLVGNLVLPNGVTSVGSTWISGSTAAETITHCWAALVGKNDLKIKAVSADLGATTWTAETIKTFAWAETFTPNEDLPVYLGVVVVATKMPNFATAGFTTNWTRRAPTLSGLSNTGLTTPLAVGTTVTAPETSGSLVVAALR